MIIKYHDKSGKIANIEVDPKNEKLFDIVTKTADYEIEAPCGGKGICGKCVGLVKFREEFSGNVDAFSAENSEKAMDISRYIPKSTGFDRYHTLLICKIPSEINKYIEEVILPEKAEISGAGTDEIAEKAKNRASDFERTAFRIAVKRPEFDLNSTLSVTEAVMNDVKIYIERNIGAGAEIDIHEEAISEIVKIANTRADKIYLTLVLTEDDEKPKYVVLRAAPEKRGLLGLAVDIGTTTVCAALVDLDTAEIIDEAVFGNPQRKHGADVISRMQFESENGTEIQSREINDAVEAACREMLNKHTKFNARDIVCSVIAGNSIMQSIYKNIPTYSLSKAPFTLPERMGRTVLKDDFSLRAEFAEPLPASYVGGDITSGLSYIFSNEEIATGNTLFLDLGTNGEIALIKANPQGENSAKEIYLAATAAGPALEGANIEIGKPAVDGAVTRVNVTADGEFSLKTVKNGDPDGICGSGIISAAASALRTGLLTEYGRICDDGEAENEKYAEIYENYNKYIEEDDRGRLRIKFDDDGKIYLTEGDFRQIQTAKSAIAAGIETLLFAAEMTEKDIDRVYIAGSFGRGIDVDDAKDIGLLPDIEAPVCAVGNTSVKGAIMYMLNKDARRNVDIIMKNSKYIELSSSAKFTEKFIDNMIFPQP